MHVVLFRCAYTLFSLHLASGFFFLLRRLVHSLELLLLLGRLGGIVPHGEWQPHPLDGYDPTWFPLVYLAHIWLHESACVRQRHTWATAVAGRLNYVSDLQGKFLPIVHTSVSGEGGRAIKTLSTASKVRSGKALSQAKGAPGTSMVSGQNRLESNGNLPRRTMPLNLQMAMTSKEREPDIAGTPRATRAIYCAGEGTIRARKTPGHDEVNGWIQSLKKKKAINNIQR
ncbi:Bcl-6 corepressor [Plakobranchus ocellatus]|uniref:Bcl-6 corepressor n=1 Tax=Plakobranchus ocellatus TaxID=259542 RepID=A0AAV3XSX9_9GAST|nr:Bcl-6 corepressor [Plakobranchus ocellatus]